MTSTLRARNWFFTHNNYSETDILSYISDGWAYTFQEEMGKSGTAHLQGVIMFKNARTLAQLKKLNPKAHWEVAKNVHACRAYCTKIDSRNGKIYTNVTLTKKPGNLDTDTIVSGKEKKAETLEHDMIETIKKTYNEMLIESKKILDEIDSRPKKNTEIKNFYTDEWEEFCEKNLDLEGDLGDYIRKKYADDLYRIHIP